MIRVLLLAVLLLTLAWAFWRLIDGVIETFGGTTPQRAARRPKVPAVKLVRDPVCGTWVSPTNSKVLTVGSSTHHFCSEACLGKFQRK